MKQYKTAFPDTLRDLYGAIDKQCNGLRYVSVESMHVSPDTVARLKRIQALAAAALAYIDEEEGKEGSHE